MQQILRLTEPGLATGGSVRAKGKSFYDRVRRRSTLTTAWHVVHANGIASRSEDTRMEVKQFALSAEKNIDWISGRLRKKSYKFPPSLGIPTKRHGKSPRPIVKSPIGSRIVQRAILDVLQEEPAIERYYKIPTSFGGIKGKGLGVPGAIEAACRAIEDGASHFIRSDIKGFFANIPREIVLAKISSAIQDSEFNKLLEEATRTELENLSRLGKDARLFPTYEIGVAQGCCLSPLLGNILLEKFDRSMNGRRITCLRYIDDFLILGPSLFHVKAAFSSAQKQLREHSLTAYDPLLDKDKAEIGETKRSLEFLGCEIRPGVVRPNKTSRKRLLKNVDEIFETSARLMSKPTVLAWSGLSFVETLINVSNVVRGWGDQYSFCNDSAMWATLDSEIGRKIEGYCRQYQWAKNREERYGSAASLRQLLGVHLLRDSKFRPILPLRLDSMVGIEEFVTPSVASS